jgi:hypothetical protein
MSEINFDVQNGTTETNTSLGQVRVIENESGLVITHYITDCERLVNEFTGFAVKTAQSTVEMCRVVFEAKKSLKKVDFIKFCNEIGHKSEDSTIRKYLCIGENYERLIKYTNLLPNSWTSIYTITQLPSDVFEALALTGSSMANMTGSQIKLLMEPTKPSTPPKSAEATTAPLPSVKVPTNAENTQSAVSAAQDSSSDAASAVESSDARSSASMSMNDTVNDHEDAVSDQSVPTPDLATPSKSDQEFAKQATFKIVADARATTKPNNERDDDEPFVPYSITIRFNKMPSEAAAQELTEMLISIKSKHRLDLDISSDAAVLA